MFSLPYMGLVLAMAYELSRDVLRASQLVRDLQASEAGLRENQARLEASNQQISSLFGRLIAAQETERTRIARDLHDDIGQRIAGISIAMSGLKRKLEAHDAALAALVAMQRETIALADGVRQVSHELHPTLLQHAGLVEALRALVRAIPETPWPAGRLSRRARPRRRAARRGARAVSRGPGSAPQRLETCRAPAMSSCR